MVIIVVSAKAYVDTCAAKQVHPRPTGVRQPEAGSIAARQLRGRCMLIQAWRTIECCVSRCATTSSASSGISAPFKAFSCPSATKSMSSSSTKACSRERPPRNRFVPANLRHTPNDGPQTSECCRGTHSQTRNVQEPIGQEGKGAPVCGSCARTTESLPAATGSPKPI